MPKKIIEDKELEEVDEVEEIKEEVIEKPIKREKKRKAYKVILVTDKVVVFESPPGCGCHTNNIWGTELKIGDTIYLEEE